VQEFEMLVAECYCLFLAMAPWLYLAWSLVTSRLVASVLRHLECGLPVLIPRIWLPS
jgi:hypothetical protein